MTTFVPALTTTLLAVSIWLLLRLTVMQAIQWGGQIKAPWTGKLMQRKHHRPRGTRVVKSSAHAICRKPWGW